jgi:hypothetical protein
MIQNQDGIMTGDFRCNSRDGLVRNSMRGYWMQACTSFLDKSKIPACKDITTEIMPTPKEYKERK